MFLLEPVLLVMLTRASCGIELPAIPSINLPSMPRLNLPENWNFDPESWNLPHLPQWKIPYITSIFDKQDAVIIGGKGSLCPSFTCPLHERTVETCSTYCRRSNSSSSEACRCPHTLPCLQCPSASCPPCTCPNALLQKTRQPIQCKTECGPSRFLSCPLPKCVEKNPRQDLCTPCSCSGTCVCPRCAEGKQFPENCPECVGLICPPCDCDSRDKTAEEICPICLKSDVTREAMRVVMKGETSVVFPTHSFKALYRTSAEDVATFGIWFGVVATIVMLIVPLSIYIFEFYKKRNLRRQQRQIQERQRAAMETFQHFTIPPRRHVVEQENPEPLPERSGLSRFPELLRNLLPLEASRDLPQTHRSRSNSALGADVFTVQPLPSSSVLSGAIHLAMVNTGSSKAPLNKDSTNL